MKIIEERKIIFIILFILFLLIPFIFAYFLSRQPPQPIKSRAEEEDPNFCQNSCKPDGSRCDLNNPNSNYDAVYNDPCCQEIAKTGDPFACGDWVARGYCTIDQCNAIPEGVNRQRCGGPRWHWCELCKEHKCPGYVNATPSPTPPTAFPTSPPPPTQSPFIPSKPTTIPVFPTTIIPFLPTEEPPPPLPTSAPFQLKLPKFIVPPEANRVVEKPLGFFRWVFLRIRKIFNF